MATIKIEIAHTEPHNAVNIVKMVSMSDLTGKHFYKWYRVNDSAGNSFYHTRKCDAIKHAKKAVKCLNEKIGANYQLIIEERNNQQ